MNIIIPMAGNGNRFVQAGYKDPKPIIKVRGKRTIDYVCDMYDRDNDNFFFICNEDHLRDTDMGHILKDMVSKATVISMPTHKLGPVFTVLAMQDHIADTEPAIVSYCDTPVLWNYNDFLGYVDVNGVDGCIISHTGFHPHTLSPTLFAYSKTDKSGKVYEIKEKACYTNNKFSEHASSGAYYFRYGHYIKKYFRQALNERLQHKGEYYVTLVYNLLIKDGLSVYSYLNDQVLAFGTPKDVQNFEAWMAILEGEQVSTEEDVISCYNYWKRYRHDSNFTQG